MKIPLFKIYWDEEDVKAVSDSLRQGMNWAAGPNIVKFEEQLSKYIGRKYALVFNSGTSAMHSALIAYGIEKDDEVIIPSFSFIATSNVPLMVQAKPVFADIENETYGLDVEDVRRKITNKTKAIIPMHYGGVVARDIEKIREFAKEKKLLLIEDAAESFGAMFNGKKVGTFGDSAMFSFCQTKVFTTGEGGCIITDSEDLYEKMKLIRAHGRAENGNYFTTGEYMDYVTLGYNYRMSDCVAALGVSQLNKIDKLISIRREKSFKMAGLLKDLKIDDIVIPEFSLDIFHVYQEFHIRIKSGKLVRDALKKYLFDRGIGTRISFPPIHLTHYYKNVLGYNEKLPITERIASETLTLPLYPNLSDEEMGYIQEQIKDFYGAK
jgi:perosamine synthetase